MHRIIAAVALGTLATSPLGNCGTSNAPPPAAPAIQTTTPTPTTTNAPGTLYAKADLDAALLSRTDMPAGFAPDAQADPGSVMSGCTHEAIVLEGYRTVAPAKAGTAYSTTSGQMVAQSIILLSGDAETSTLVTLRQAVALCTTWSIDKSSYTMSKADYGPYGDESLGYRVTVKSEIPFVFDVVFVRKANLLMGVMVLVAGQGSSPPKGARAIIETAVKKLPKG